jgi:arsenate reductase
LFRENNIDFEKVDYFIAPLSKEKLIELLQKANLSPFDVLRKNEPAYKELNIAQIKDENKLIALIVENPGLLQRPIVEVGDRAVLARPVENALELINSAR